MNDQCNQSNNHIYHFQMFPCNLFLFFFFFFMVILVKFGLCSLVLNRNADSFGWSGKEWLCGFARQRGRLMPSRLCVSPGGGSEESMKFKEQGVVNFWKLFWLVGGEVIRSQHHQPSAGVYMLVGSMQATSPTWWGFQYLQNSSKDVTILSIDLTLFNGWSIVLLSCLIVFLSFCIFSLLWLDLFFD